MADFITTESGIYVVSNETEFNQAIDKVNAGGHDKINIVAPFTLTDNTRPFTKSAEVTSSTDSEIHDGGFSVVTVKNSAIVKFGVRSKGTGTSYVIGPNGSALVGVSGGSLANLAVLESGKFKVPSGEKFSIGGALSLGHYSELTLGGILYNNQPVTTDRSLVTVEGSLGSASNQDHEGEGILQAEPAMGPLILAGETFMTIAPDTVVILGKTKVDTICQIKSDGTGSVWSADTIEVVGNNLQDPGQIAGTNVSTIELKNGGLFCGRVSDGVFDGNTADTIINTSGDFQMGAKGSCTVKDYKQTGGHLKFQIDNFEGHTAHLSLSETVDVSGGNLEIEARLYHIPDSTKSTVSTLITAPGSSAGLQELAHRVEFKGFHAIEPNKKLTLTPSVEVVGDKLNLVLTVIDH
ncbi:hypothetical protein [Roseibium marinum]|uniref:Uncharacterized protein n=1 Tax=Roseibium marinum TaxID=281252 RepID=A0A2S3UVK7_9HYPH|nr:hypothetical protein [Roseibium marinum]POF31762.1 hypothetical protein CLV41_104332 [Roseibium marinum]